MKLKEINWDIAPLNATARVMGVTLAVYLNNNKWDARLVNHYQRPEIQSGFNTAQEAMRYAELVLLRRELAKYFTHLGD